MFSNLLEAVAANRTAELLNTEHVGLSKAERWQLIEHIDYHIDQCQGWLLTTKPLSQARYSLSSMLQGLRLKRFQVWSCFYPQFKKAIRSAAHGY